MKTKINKESRAEELFSQTPIKKAIWIVAIPSLMITLMIGLYTFVDQVFIQQFVPRTRVIMSNGELGEISAYLTAGQYSFDSYFQLFNQYNAIEGIAKVARISANSVVSTTNASAQPLLIFSNAIVFLVPLGASVYYTKCLSKKLNTTARNLWATMFWATVSLSLLSTLLIIALTAGGILNLLAGKNILDQQAAIKGGMSEIQVKELQDYYNAANALSVKWAKEYIYVYAAGIVLQGLVSLFSFFIRAEGFNTYTMFIGILANIINISLDALFIIVFKMGVLGGMLATIIGWAFNLIAYIIYVQIKHSRKEMQMTLGAIWRFKFSKELIGPTFLLGLGGFLRSFGVAVSFAIVNILLTKPAFADPGHFQFYWAKSAPIITLFLISVFGISDGARSLLSYNYTKRNFDRCKQVYNWTLVVSLTYAIFVYVFILATSGNLWVLALNVSPELKKATAEFIMVMTLRIVLTSFSVCSILAFQGTNDIEKSLFATTLENFTTFIVVMPLGYLFAHLGYTHTNSKDVGNWIIIASFIFNGAVASTILLIFSRWYIYKKLPKIDNTKLSWSRKIEHRFFENATKFEAKHAV